VFLNADAPRVLSSGLAAWLASVRHHQGGDEWQEPWRFGHPPDPAGSSPPAAGHPDVCLLDAVYSAQLAVTRAIADHGPGSTNAQPLHHIGALDSEGLSGRVALDANRDRTQQLQILQYGGR